MTAVAEAVFIRLLGKEFEVHADDGTIWRIAQRSRTGQRRPVMPRRADPARSDGYRWVRVAIDNVNYVVGAHRLVWLALRGAIPDGLEPNHRNGDRGDNRPNNLELVTKGENLAHAYSELGRIRMSGGRNGRAVLTALEVTDIRGRAERGEGYRPLARAYGVTHRTIRLIALGLTWRDEYPVEVSRV